MAKRDKSSMFTEDTGTLIMNEDKKSKKSDVDDMMKDLISSINKEFGTRVAYNLSEMDAPTVVKRWIDTGSIQLNYAIRNALGGGYPEGRIIEISGAPSCGKSHLAYHAAAVTQSMGGLVVYVDTENATPVAKLAAMGIDVKRRFVYVDTHCTEEVFSIIESTVLKAKQVVDKNIPILVVWDSVAATSPKAELDGEYEDNTIGLQARVISKGMRKITGVIGQNNVTLLCLNQIREKIGCVGPSTKLTVKKDVTTTHQQVSISDLFANMGYSYLDMKFDEPIDVTSHGYEVLTQDSSGDRRWDLIKKIVRKQSTDTYRVDDFDLNVSPLHKFWACVEGSNPHWVEATALADCKNVKLFHQDTGWVDASVLHLPDQTDILDIEVEDSHSYFSNGILSHNTMYGDPTTTPGGRAIPFHSSVRISLGSGNPVKDKDGNVIGIHTTVTVKKNKVAAPFRKCEFDIIFGKGIVEDEYLFDEARSHCKSHGPVKRDGKEINISGEGSWKELTVTDSKTGEVVLEKKFYKSDFGSLLRNEKYRGHILAALDGALTIETGAEVSTDGADESEAIDG